MTTEQARVIYGWAPWVQVQFYHRMRQRWGWKWVDCNGKTKPTHSMTAPEGLKPCRRCFPPSPGPQVHPKETT